METHSETIKRLARRIDEVLEPIVTTASGGRALVDFPSHPNVGDSAIWLGETTWLARRGWQPVYVCDTTTYSRERLAATVRDGLILIHGGGNFGDFWTDHQELRERVVQDFPDNSIVQLPQTIYYMEQANSDRTRRIFDAHKRLTLLCRDRASLEFATRQFAAPSSLCPDMALVLGPLSRTNPAVRDVLWLCRTDEESSGSSPPPCEAGVEISDWLEEDSTPMRNGNEELSALLWRNPMNWRSLQQELMLTYDPLAEERLRRGCGILSRGQVVISDRLHGHIISLLMGIPHVMIENLYGKLRAFYDTWTCGSELTRWANSPSEALKVGLELARNSGNAQEVLEDLGSAKVEDPNTDSHKRN